MAKSTKSYEERMLEMEKKEQESLEKAKRYATGNCCLSEKERMKTIWRNQQRLMKKEYVH